MDQVLAVVLQVHPFSRRVGGDQDAQRLLVGIGIELGFQALAVLLAHAAAEARHPLLGLFLTQQLPQLPLQVALGVNVIREDQQSCGLPLQIGRTQARAEVLPQPVRQLADAGVGAMAMGTRDRRHLLQ